ncbi:MAG TPA: CAP domain-containing protein [Candidatus Binatia bacterium]|nr:CAP domain-containing protein [Candidatus Binatia bacterium]
MTGIETIATFLAMKWSVFVVCMSVVAGLPASQIISRPASSIKKRDAIDLFTNYNSSSFAKLPEARTQIDLEHINQDLLDAAVFHETNRRRQERGLPALAYHDKARTMAQIQARAMAKGRFVEHTNPERDKGTLADRAKFVGLRPRFAAENVASTFGRRYKSGQPFYTREEGGRKIYSYEPNGKPIPIHTYLSFAEDLVDSWMQSPGHRENILHKTPQYLGCACELSRDATAMETFYCAQVFLKPTSN